MIVLNDTPLCQSIGTAGNNQNGLDLVSGPFFYMFENRLIA